MYSNVRRPRIDKTAKQAHQSIKYMQMSACCKQYSLGKIYQRYGGWLEIAGGRLASAEKSLGNCASSRFACLGIYILSGLAFPHKWTL